MAKAKPVFGKRDSSFVTVTASNVFGAFICFACVTSCCLKARSEETTATHVTVSGESDEEEHDQFHEPGDYGQPAWAERNRAATTTRVFVLSPYELFVGAFWEGDFNGHGRSTHDLVQEIDFGLPHRIEIGLENQLGLIGSRAYETSVSLEGRYAFANWNALQFNPAVSVEYTFGTGKSVLRVSHRRPKMLREQPDAVTARLLLAHEFAGQFAYGLNVAMEQDLYRDSGRAFEISQSLSRGLMKGKFEIGAEMRYTHRTSQTQFTDENELVIGPSIGWKPTRQMRVAFAPLLGCTAQSPRLATFFLVSYEFGGAEVMLPSSPTTAH